MNWTEEDRRRTGEHPLPDSGAPNDKICTQPNRDYPADTDICFARGNSETRVRLTPADLPKLFAAAGGLAPGLEELHGEARKMGGGAWEVYPGELAREAVSLVDAAHAAGYKLAADDHRETYQERGVVTDYLVDAAHAAGYKPARAVGWRLTVADYLDAIILPAVRASRQEISGELFEGPDVAALGRVIVLLRGQQ
jgi:hypothetical protein